VQTLSGCNWQKWQGSNCRLTQTDRSATDNRDESTWWSFQLDGRVADGEGDLECTCIQILAGSCPYTARPNTLLDISCVYDQFIITSAENVHINQVCAYVNRPRLLDVVCFRLAANGTVDNRKFSS